MFLLRFLLYFLVFIHSVQTEGPIFVGAFNDLKANEGGVAYFRCSFQSRNKETETPVWRRSGTTILRESQVLDNSLNKRFKADLQGTVQGTKIEDYNLVIDPVERSDGEYTYKCVILKNDDDTIVIQSEPMALIITEIPGMQYPAFEPLKEKYMTGSEIDIICFTEKTENSKNELKLFKEGILVKTAKHDDDTYDKIKYTFIADPADNAKSFRCHLYSSILSEGRNKTTGLINIEFAPNVSIYEPEDIFENKEAIFICRCVSNPTQVTYRWEFSKNLKLGDYKIEEGNEQILRIKKPNSINNGSTVTCLVENEVGVGKNMATLRVKKQNLPTKPPTTSPPADPLPDEMTLAIIIAAAGGCSVLIILIIILPMYYRYLKNCLFQPNIDMTGTQIAQPDIYFEPKDSIRPPLPTPDHVEQWRISVGIQVSPESNEHSYTEVGGNSSKGSDQIYGGSINDAATATYRSKSVYV